MERLNRFDADEIAVCTYLAQYGSEMLGGFNHVAKTLGRSELSIKAKVGNFVALLKENGRQYCKEIAPLSGTNSGKVIRDTDWEMLAAYSKLTRRQLLAVCRLSIPVI